MSSIARILADVAHRPWPLPAGSWRYYQEWNEALFLHWKVPPAILAPLVPAGLTVDTQAGEAWVSLVAFTMQRIRPRYLPALAPVSDFHEINLRTYVVRDGQAGVYFLNIEAHKRLSAYLSRALSGLPYEQAAMHRSGRHYHSRNARKSFLLDAEFTVGEAITAKTGLDSWLTERYCLYLARAGAVRRYDIQHLPWPLARVELSSLQLHYQVGELLLDKAPDLAHYSAGVQVLAWGQRGA
jgi:uncharacterized protein YqjF (DUF2071 family)